MPIFDITQRANLVQHGRGVYFSYLCLHALKKRCLDTVRTSAGDSCDLALGETNLSFTRTANADGSITLTLIPPADMALPQIKGVKEYSDAEFARVIASQSPITFYPQQNTFSVNLPGGTQIGGADKIDLYELHISNLGQIIKCIEPATFNSNMLVSLTTGSGKTFTQALWMQVLAEAGLSAAFGVPANLVEQFKLDLTRLLPNDFLVSHPDITIDSVENILSNPDNQEKDFYCFDEAHLIAGREDLFVKAQGIAGNRPSMFLTATPTPALKKLASGSDGRTRLVTVASMSNADKVRNGYAEAVTSTAKSAKSIEEIHGRFDFKRKLADWVDKETGYDASLAFGEAYLYHVNQRQVPGPVLNAEQQGLNAAQQQERLRNAVRWTIQPSAFQGKTLICANHFEDVVNLDLFARNLGGNQPQQEQPQHYPAFNQRFYSKGNVFNRDNTYQFLQIQGVTPDQTAYTEYAQSCYEQFSAELTEKITAVHAQINSGADEAAITALKDQMLAGLTTAPIENSKHGIVELGLSILASRAANGSNRLTDILQNFGSKYLDEQRLANLTTFAASLGTVANEFTEDDLRTMILYNEATNPRGLTAEQTNELVPLLRAVFQVVGNTHNPDAARQMVDNWFADATLFDRFPPLTRTRFDEFAQKHYKKYVFNHVEKNETIIPGQVFNGFEEQTHGIGINNAAPGYTAKVRTKRAVEALNPYDEEVVFNPQHQPGDTQTNADNLFLLGITTLYCTDTKIAGFNDPNLHQVAVLAHSQENELANPANVIQAYGRNRGLNANKTPNFFLVTQKGVECLFGDVQLNKDDYQTDYFDALKEFKPVYLEKLAQQLADNILLWIEANRDALHEVDDEELSDEVIKYLFHTLEEINKTNAYQFNLSVKDFHTVLETSIQHLQSKKSDLSKGTPLGLFARIVAKLAFWAAKILRSSAAKESRRAVDNVIANRNIGADPDEKRAIFYHKALGIPFETLGKHNKAQKLIAASMLKEAQGLPKIRDKYYSAMLVDPVACLDEQTQRDIDPQVKILLEGFCSFAALSTVQEKEDIFNSLQLLKSDVDPEEHVNFLGTLLRRELNPRHRDRKLHLARINNMLDILGLDVQNDVAGLQEYCRDNENTITDRALTKLIEKRQSIQNLQFTDHSVRPAIDNVHHMIGEDIKSLIHPFLTEPAYRNMLKFVDSQFSDDELATALVALETNTQVVSLRAFIADTLNQPANYYHKYCLPEANELWNNQDINPQNLPFAVNLGWISQLFEILQECHLRYYKMDESGSIAHPTVESALFFRSNHGINPALRAVAAGYDIALRNPDCTLSNPMTMYFQKVGDGTVFNVTQVKADGNQIVRAVDIGGLDGSIISALQVAVHNVSYIDFTPEQRNALNTFLTTEPYQFETLFSPSVNDETTPRGELWRHVHGLHGLKQALPIFDSTQRLARTREIDKAIDVGSNMLKGILKKDSPHSSNPLIAKSKMFFHILSEEGKQAPKPSLDALGNHHSRVEKMETGYQSLKKQYNDFELNPRLKQSILAKIRRYIRSNAATDMPDNAPLTAKPTRFFNDALTTEKLRFAQRLMQNIRSATTYADVLSVTERAIKEHNKIMRRFNKNPTSSSRLGDILDSVHASLLAVTIGYSPENLNDPSV